LAAISPSLASAIVTTTATQLVELHDLGMPDPALDYMQRAYVEEQRASKAVKTRRITH